MPSNIDTYIEMTSNLAPMTKACSTQPMRGQTENTAQHSEVAKTRWKASPLKNITVSHADNASKQHKHTEQGSQANVAERRMRGVQVVKKMTDSYTL